VNRASARKGRPGPQPVLEVGVRELRARRPASVGDSSRRASARDVRSLMSHRGVAVEVRMVEEGAWSSRARTVLLAEVPERGRRGSGRRAAVSSPNRLMSRLDERPVPRRHDGPDTNQVTVAVALSYRSPRAGRGPAGPRRRDSPTDPTVRAIHVSPAPCPVVRVRQCGDKQQERGERGEVRSKGHGTMDGKGGNDPRVAATW